MRRLAAIVVLALSAAGCSTVGNGHLVQLDAAQAQALLVPGRTTRNDVRQALGEGAVIRFRSGRETWHYAYRRGLAKGWDDVPYVNLIAARIDGPVKELVILFDANGVLERWSLQTYRPRDGAAGISPALPEGRSPAGVFPRNSFMRYYLNMNNPERNRSAQSMAAAERAHSRAGAGGIGDVAIYVLMRTCNVMMHERLAGLLEPHGLAPLGYMTMMALYSRAENLANPSELSDATGETRGNMTRICDDLVDKGWMKRVANAEDRRRVDLSLTDSGMALLNTLAPQLRQNADDFYKRTFSKTEKATLQQLLTQFSEALANEL